VKRLVKASLVAFVVVATGTPATASQDGVAALRNKAGASLQWDNITRHAYWMAGPVPTHDRRHGWHAVDLENDALLTLHLPAHAMLRIVADPDGPADVPFVAVSEGSGLALEKTFLQGEDGRSWLLKADPADASFVVHLGRAQGAGGRQRIALFVGRVAAPAEPVLYPQVLALGGEQVLVRRADEAVARSYTRVAAGETLVAPVRQAERLMLTYQLDSARAGSSSGNALTAVNALPRLEAAFPGQPVKQISQVTGPETTAPFNIGGQWRAASRQENFTTDVAPGQEHLRLSASHDMLVHITAASKNEFLIPSLNAPAAWRGRDSDQVLEATEQSMLATAASNQWRDISLLAATKFQQAAASRPGHPAALAAAQELAGQFTQYQDLAPDRAAAVQARSVIRQQPQPVDEAARSHIHASRDDLPPAPLALFHQVDGEPLRYLLPRVSYPIHLRIMVPREAPMTTLELRHDDGKISRLIPVLPLDGKHMRPDGAALAMVGPGTWPAALDGRADRAGTLAPLSEVASMEWLVPPGVTSITLRSTNGTLPVALQWGAAKAYFLDDAFLAALVDVSPIGDAGKRMQEDALRPLHRMLAAAHAQFIAEVVPPAPATEQRSPASTEAAARAAAAEKDPAQAVVLWAQAMRAADPVMRAKALQGQVRALFAAGDRFNGERLLRSYWLAGNDPVLIQAAQEELEALYQAEGDRAMQTLFAAARAARAPGDSAAMATLANALAGDGDDALALLAGLSASEKALPMLLQSALRSRLWRTFDAMLSHLTHPRDVEFWKGQRALLGGQTAQAQAHFIESGEMSWHQALTAGSTIAATLQDASTDKASTVAAWLDWQGRHPGARVWRDEPQALARHDGAVRLRSISLNLRSTWWRASAARPMVARLVGPVRILVEARPLHSAADGMMSGWLRIRTANQLWVQPFDRNRPTPGLEAEGLPILPGAAVLREINLPGGLHEIRIDAGDLPIATRLQVQRPALQLPVLPAPAAIHFTSHSGLIGTEVAAPACGKQVGCQLLANGTLYPSLVRFDVQPWIRLPVAPGGYDPVATALADGDVEGALKNATDPGERMRLLLWLAEVKPAERARAVALGAALADRYPTQEIRAQWERLAVGSRWVNLPLVDRSAGLRSLPVLPASPESPSARIRAALLVPLRPGELRATGDARVTLMLNQASRDTVRIEVAMEELPGVASLPVTVKIELNGLAIRQVRLETTGKGVTLPLTVPAGPQQLSVSILNPLLNQSLRVRFTGARQPLESITRDWHVATAAEPVRVMLGGPVFVRIDRLDKDGVHSQHRLLPDAVAQLTLAPVSGHAETLYRVYQRRIDPHIGSALPARPLRYRPEPLPQVPAEWQAPSAQSPQGVRFTDAMPLGDRSDHTFSLRAAASRRRNSEAMGGSGGAEAEQFVETGVNWRHRSKDDTSGMLADLLLRYRQGGSPVAGFRIAGDRQEHWSARLPFPYAIDYSVDGFAQNTPDGAGWSLLAQAGVSQTRMLGSGWSHRPAVAARARLISLDAVTDPARVDSDVFTRYHAQHRLAVAVSDTLSWRPWRDTHLATRLTITSNPDLNVFNPDHMRIDAHWRQLLGRLVLDAGGRVTHYRADSARASASTRRDLYLEATLDWWLPDRTRVELRSALRHDPGLRYTWGGVEMRWHWDGGRQLRDFSTNEMDFRTLRNWHAPVPANRIDEQ